MRAMLSAHQNGTSVQNPEISPTDSSGSQGSSFALFDMEHFYRTLTYTTTSHYLAGLDVDGLREGETYLSTLVRAPRLDRTDSGFRIEILVWVGVDEPNRGRCDELHEAIRWERRTDAESAIKQCECFHNSWLA